MTEHSLKKSSIFGLLTASLFWGAEFVVEKDVLSIMGANYSNSIRFFIAGIIMTVVSAPYIKKITRNDIINGIVTGAFMGLGFAFQTMGLGFINAGENALLCSAYILIIPFAEWILFKKQQGYAIFLYAAVATIGIGLISYDPSGRAWSFSVGEIITLAGSLFYAGAIISINRLSVETDSRILTTLQFYMITIISAVFAISFEEIPKVFTTVTLAEFIYLILFATIGAQALMNHCIRFVSSSAAGIIFSSESIFAAVLGILILNEPSNIYIWTGIILIVGSITLYNIGFPWRKKIKEYQ